MKETRRRNIPQGKSTLSSKEDYERLDKLRVVEDILRKNRIALQEQGMTSQNSKSSVLGKNSSNSLIQGRQFMTEPPNESYSFTPLKEGSNEPIGLNKSRGESKSLKHLKKIARAGIPGPRELPPLASDFKEGTSKSKSSFLIKKGYSQKESSMNLGSISSYHENTAHLFTEESLQDIPFVIEEGEFNEIPPERFKLLSKFSGKFLKEYMSNTRLIDIASANSVKDSFAMKELESEAEKVQEIQSLELQEANTKQLKEIEERDFFFSDRRAMIFRIPAQNKLFPLHVAMESRLEEIESYFSRWDSKPSPAKHETHFITKEFRVTFDEKSGSQSSKCHNVYMTVLLKKLANVRIKIWWAGETKSEKNEGDADEKIANYREFKKNKKKKKSFSAEFKEYILFYQKAYLRRDDDENKKHFSRKVKQKIMFNIANQAQFFENKREQLPQLVNLRSID